jgi:hypothetical protein
MKPPRQNVGKAGTKPLPDGVGVAVRPFPIHLFNAAFDAPHDLGERLTPEQMAAKATPQAIAEANREPPDKVPASVSPRGINRAARKALDALVGCGPKQDVPHFDTALLLAEGLARLRDFAIAGDAAAMRVFGSVLSQAVADLREMARVHPAIVREWSRKQNVVPVLTGKNKGHRTQLAADLDAFGVGEATPYRVNPQGKKVPVISTPANALAGQLCQHLAYYRAIFPCLQKPPEWASRVAKLEPLSNATWEPWADAAWKCLMSATGSQPQADPKLAALGIKKATAKQDKLSKQTADLEYLKRRSGLIYSKRPLHARKVTPAAIRAEIHETLKEAVRMIASEASHT